MVEVLYSTERHGFRDTALQFKSSNANQSNMVETYHYLVFF